MNYLLYGLEEYLIIEKEKEISAEFDESAISYYNLEEDSMKDIIDDANTAPMFNDKKLIIVDNSYLFTGMAKKESKTNDLKILEEYLCNPNKFTVIIFKVNVEKVDERKKITKILKNSDSSFEFNEISNIDRYILEKLKPYKISSLSLNLFIDRVGENVRILSKEIEKIKLYKDTDLEITDDDILNLTCKNVDIDIFHLIDNIINKKRKDAIDSYDEMIKRKEEPIKILITLANQIRILYQVKCFLNQGYSEKDIANILEIHPYRVKLAGIKCRSYSEDTLINLLERLADLDYKIKTSKVDKVLGLKILILTWG